jgi:hypothetical protein
MSSNKILQILPADGWFASFTYEDGDESMDAVMCFALVESVEDGRAVQSVQPMVWSGGEAVLCDDLEGFEGIVRADEVGDDDDDEDSDD